MKKTALLKEELLDRLELSEKLCIAAPRILVSGGRKTLVENHRGVLEYSGERIVLSLGRGRLCLSGTGLLIDAMNDRELLISGKLQSIEWE